MRKDVGLRDAPAAKNLKISCYSQRAHSIILNIILIKSEDTGCSLNIVFFSKKFMIFLNSASSAAALVFYLLGVCTHTDTEGKQSPEYILKSSKKTIFNKHPVSYHIAGALICNPDLDIQNHEKSRIRIQIQTQYL